MIGGTGCYCYVGVPGAGKTSLAWHHLRQLVADDRSPALVIDTIGDPRFAAISRPHDLAGAVRRLWRERRHTRWVPARAADALDGDAERRRLVAELERLFAAVFAGGAVHVLLDDSAFFYDASACRSSNLLRIARSWRHANVTLQVTTQHASGDLSQAMFSCAPRLFVFRTCGPAALDSLERAFGVHPEEARALPMPEGLLGGVAVHYLEVDPSGGIVRKRKVVPDRLSS